MRKKTNGAGPSCTKVVKQPRDFKGGKDSFERDVVEQNLEQIIFFLQEVNFQEYASITT